MRKDTLSLIATHYDIGSKIILGDGERKSGGHRRDSIISDALEALIAVVYLVEGPEATRKFISKVFEKYINILPSNDDLKDSKTKLQELLQSHNIELPLYETTEVNKNNKIYFRTLCKIIKHKVCEEGIGGNKRKSQQEAAKKSLEKINIIYNKKNA